MSIQQPLQTEEIIYPYEDGEPLAESDIHAEAIVLLWQALRDVYRDSDVYVAADMFWYWEEGNVKARRAPDVMVIPGVGQHKRKAFLSWREGGAFPSVIFEISSDSTLREDLYVKRKLYGKLGVQEYFLFDPERLCLIPQLQGFRLHNQTYVPLEPDDQDRLHSVEMKLFLQTEGQAIRLLHENSGKPILTREERIAEMENQRDIEKQRAELEKQRADEAVAEIARLQALLMKSQNSENGES